MIKDVFCTCKSYYLLQRLQVCCFFLKCWFDVKNDVVMIGNHNRFCINNVNITICVCNKIIQRIEEKVYSLTYYTLTKKKLLVSAFASFQSSNIYSKKKLFPSIDCYQNGKEHGYILLISLGFFLDAISTK